MNVLKRQLEFQHIRNRIFLFVFLAKKQVQKAHLFKSEDHCPHRLLRQRQAHRKDSQIRS